MATALASSHSQRLASHATRHDEVRDFGKVLSERLPSGLVRFRIDFGILEGRRYILGGVVRPDGKLDSFGSSQKATETLYAIRADMVARELKPLAVLGLWFARGPAPEDLIGERVKRYIAHYRTLVAEGQRSPTTLRELERYAKAGGHWGWWEGRPIHGLAYADVADWHRWLATRDLSAKTRKNVSDAFRAMLRWWKDRDDAVTVPKFDAIRVRRYVPTIISMDEQARVLAAIPWDRRGAFMAAAYEALRMGEIRALDLSDYHDGRLRVTKAVQGPRVNAPIADHTKNDAGEVREVWHPDLIAWLDWRATQATSAAKLAGAVALFWNPTARNKARRWTPDPMEQEWRRACKAAGVTVPLQEGTRHAILTQLGGALTERVLQAFSRHRDQRSLAHYSKPKAGAKAIARAIKGD